MQTARIPLLPSQETAFEELSGGSPYAINVVADQRGAVRVRPGLADYGEAPKAAIDEAGIAGIHVTAGGLLYVVGGGTPERSIYRLLGGASKRLSDQANRGLAGSSRPVFAETEMLLVLAGGDQVQKVELASDVTDRLGGSPPMGTHVIAHSARLFVDGGAEYPSRVHWSDVATGGITYAGHEVWSYGVGTAGFTTAEVRPDPVVAIHETASEIWVWGSQTLQRFAPDPSYVVSPVGATPNGCSAPHSIIALDGEFAWLDDRRRFVVSNGAVASAISQAIQWQLDSLPVVSDCFGYRVRLAVGDVWVWTFPSAGVTYAYQAGVGWGQWQGRATAGWRAFGVSALHLRRDTNVHVVGTPDGLVRRLDERLGTDLGVAVVADVATGFESHDTDARKHCARVRVAMRRDSSVSGLLHLTYRDSPADPWEPELEVELGSETDPVVEFSSLGVYRYRQWRLTFQGSGNTAIASVTETFEVGDS